MITDPAPRRQERARAACLKRLVGELHAYGVGELLIESRTNELDRRDITTVSGAVRAHLMGDSTYQDILDERLYEIVLESGC
ncbi:hypothetical protein ACFYOT_09905 [Saccharothrix saharensis]|uniref:hypothetical protein n=1 Tax=Saccharothrix saharensis TaxID=571190 RepID=UPI0036CDDF1E